MTRQTILLIFSEVLVLTMREELLFHVYQLLGVKRAMTKISGMTCMKTSTLSNAVLHHTLGQHKVCDHYLKESGLVTSLIERPLLLLLTKTEPDHKLDRLMVHVLIRTAPLPLLS